MKNVWAFVQYKLENKKGGNSPPSSQILKPVSTKWIRTIRVWAIRIRTIWVTVEGVKNRTSDKAS
jgi:hypothetical protein